MMRMTTTTTTTTTTPTAERAPLSNYPFLLCLRSQLRQELQHLNQEENRVLHSQSQTQLSWMIVTMTKIPNHLNHLKRQLHRKLQRNQRALRINNQPAPRSLLLHLLQRQRGKQRTTTTMKTTMNTTMKTIIRQRESRLQRKHLIPQNGLQKNRQRRRNHPTMKSLRRRKRSIFLLEYSRL